MAQKERGDDDVMQSIRSTSTVSIGDMVRSAYMGEGTFGIVVGFSKDWRGNMAIDVMWHSPGQEPVVECHIWYDDEVEVIDE